MDFRSRNNSGDKTMKYGWTSAKSLEKTEYERKANEKKRKNK